MKNTDYFQGKRVTVVGLARSGLACANLLFDLGAKVSVSDNQDNASTRTHAAKLKSAKIKVELGRHSEGFIKESDWIVVSPGVENTSPIITWAEQFNLPVISEIEVGGILCPAKVIAVTGTNGKTTVATLIGKILEAKGRKVFVCGNIGTPFCQEVEKMEAGDFVSLEVSSFQLERIRTFKPQVAVILNFSSNHLDRYKDLADYLAAKKRIFMNQDKNDYLVLNCDDPVVKELAKEAKGRVVYFGQDVDANPNYAAVLAVGQLLGIDRKLCTEIFHQFKGVEHRLEEVSEINKVKFINDSKATTVDATVWALRSIQQPVILIAGGREKGNDYNLVLDLVRKKVKEAVLIGEAKDKIREALRHFISTEEAKTMEEAVKKAFDKARPGDCVLLSPMCKSFDMFTDYEERGKVFKQAVAKLA